MFRVLVVSIVMGACSAKPGRIDFPRGNATGDIEYRSDEPPGADEANPSIKIVPTKACDALDDACLALRFPEDSQCTVKFSKNQNGLKILSNEEIKNSINQALGIDVSLIVRDLPNRNAGTKFDNAMARGPMSPNLVENWADLSIAIAKAFVENTMAFTQIVKCDKSDRACSDSIVDGVALGLWRSPATEADKELLFKLFGTANGVFAEAAQRVVAGILLDPRFLYKLDSSNTDNVSAYELASRMSYFLWRSAPDKLLLAKAADASLLDPEVRSKEFDRMIAMPEAEKAFRRYMTEWLALGNLDNLAITGETIDAGALRKEVLDRLSAEIFQTSADVRTAFGMGKDNVFTMPGFLGSLSVSALTNPVKRGIYFSSRILCRQVPRPPADAGAFKVETLKPDTTPRQRLALHTTQASCAICHASVDPIGLGLETFDSLGRDRSVYDFKAVIDPKGTMKLDGKFFAFEDARSLVNAIGSSEDFTACMTVTLTEFALGSGPESVNSCELSQTQVAFAKSGYRWTALMKAIVESPSFNRKVTP